MGFWHTGYQEHHQEHGFWDADQSLNLVIEYKCEYCGKKFKTSNSLIEHRFGEHPYKSPILIIRGRQLGTLPVNINTPVSPTDIAIGNVTNSILNGKRVDIKKLAEELSAVRQDNVELILSNDDLSSRYKINFNISLEADLKGVEREFLLLVEGKELSTYTIDKFIGKSVKYKSAAIYMDGLCEYFYGILAREGSGGFALAKNKYREKFNRSAEQLADYSRPLANFVKGLIAFHFNHFHEVQNFLSEGNLYKVASFFEQIFLGNDVDIESYNMVAPTLLEGMLVDDETNLILNTFRNTNPSRIDLNTLNLRADSDSVSEFGKIKIKILMIKLLIKNKITNQAIPILSELKSFSNLDPWIDQVYKKLS